MDNKSLSIQNNNDVFDHKFNATDFLHGHIQQVFTPNTWVYPQRFTEVEKRVLSSCMSWHPGLYRQMARCSAGIFLEFITDATSIYLEIYEDEYSQGAKRSLNHVTEVAKDDIYDGISVVVDDLNLGFFKPEKIREGSDETALFIELDKLGDKMLNMSFLPGLNPRRHVKIYLPCLKSARIKNLYANSSYVENVERDLSLLVLGDSLAQGFVAVDPSQNWVATLAKGLSCDVLNQGVGGQVFQPRSFEGLDEYINPKKIIVCFGANYRYEACNKNIVEKEIKAYFKELTDMFSDAHIWAITPFYHNEEAYPTHPLSCFEDIAQIIEEVADKYSLVRVVDGLELLDHTDELLIDGFEHPNEKGHKQIAKRLQTKILSRSKRPSKKKKVVKTPKNKDIQLNLFETDNLEEQTLSSYNTSELVKVDVATSEIVKKKAGGLAVIEKGPSSLVKQASTNTELVLNKDIEPVENIEESSFLDKFLDDEVFAIKETISEGLATGVFHDEKSLVVNTASNYQFMYAKDMQSAKKCLEYLNKPYHVDVCGLTAKFVLEKELGLKAGDPYYIAYWPKDFIDIKIPEDKNLVVLDESYIDIVLERYSHPEFVEREEVYERLKNGSFIGGFSDDGELCGFIGQHKEGSMGMLEVFEEYRHMGWAYYLEAQMINKKLDEGCIPWCQVFKSNRSSVALQEKLGLKILSDEHYYMT